MTVADVIVGIQARDETRKGIQSVERGFRRLSTGAGKVFKVIGAGALGLAAGIGALGLGVVALTTNYAANVKKARNISKTTGANIKQVSRLTQIFKRFNLEGEDVRDVLNEINIKLVDAQDEGSAVAQAFDMLNLSAAELQSVGSHEALLQISDALNGVEDAATRAWIADTIFGGDMAQKTLPILAMGRQGIQELGDEYERLGTVVDEEADKQAQRYEEAQRRISASLEGIGNTIGQTVLPFLADVTEKIAPLAERFARDFGEWLGRIPGFARENLGLVGDAVQAFAAGDWREGWAYVQQIAKNVFDILPTPIRNALSEIYLDGISTVNRMATGFHLLAQSIESSFKIAFAAVLAPVQNTLNQIIDGAQAVENALALLSLREARTFDKVDFTGANQLIDFRSALPGFQPIAPSHDFLRQPGIRNLGGFQRWRTGYLEALSRQNEFAEALRQANEGAYGNLLGQITDNFGGGEGGIFQNPSNLQTAADIAAALGVPGASMIASALRVGQNTQEALDVGAENRRGVLGVEYSPYLLDVLPRAQQLPPNDVNISINVTVEGNVTAEHDLAETLIAEFNRASDDGRFIGPR